MIIAAGTIRRSKGQTAPTTTATFALVTWTSSSYTTCRKSDTTLIPTPETPRRGHSLLA